MVTFQYQFNGISQWGIFFYEYFRPFDKTHLLKSLAEPTPTVHPGNKASFALFELTQGNHQHFSGAGE
jgi:hypothetical protein